MSFISLKELKSWVPNFLKHTPSYHDLNFITLHYIYIFGLTIIGSIMLYPAGNMAYVDAFVFGAGMATQSGLNTIDINKTNTYQQVVMMLIPWFANPIVINTAVVAVRLWWFEKRFHDIVSETRSQLIQRRTISKGITNEKEDGNREERGVGNRLITVLHGSDSPQPNSTQRMVLADDGSHMVPVALASSVSPSSSHFPRTATADSQTYNGNGNLNGYVMRTINERSNHHQRTGSGNIKFSDVIDNKNESAIADDDDEENDGSFFKNMPDDAQARINKHAEFFERQKQRGRSESNALKIPSPRGFDEGEQIRPSISIATEPQDLEPHNDDRIRIQDSTLPARRVVTIDEPVMTPTTPSKTRMRRMSAMATLEKIVPGAQAFEHMLSSAFKKPTLTNTSEKTSKTINSMPYLSYQPTIGRNSAFVDLTDEQRNELGGIEYRSLRILLWILIWYFFFFMVFGVVCLVPWIYSTSYGAVVTGDGQGRAWWGIFTASSMLTDLGFTITPDSMSSFNQATFPLLLGIFLIVIGNTGFPCMLRFSIWTFWKLCPSKSPHKESLHFLLDHPRRCFTLLFPSKATWVLFGILILLNAIDVILFIVLDLNDSTVTGIPVGYRVLNAFFQAASTRTAGFAVVNLADLHPAVQVSYLIMMYISAFPIAISVRRTNVYEERSLGIYGGNNEDEAAEETKEPSFVGAHLRKQLSFDLWYLFLGLFCICIAEGSRIENRTDYAFTQFSILFEVVSAYGTVGLSLGYPGFNTSFCGQFTSFSKVIICAMMMRGRHRGLPYQLDRAILLPSESQYHKEEEDAKRRIARRASFASYTTTGRDGQMRSISRRSSTMAGQDDRSHTENSRGDEHLRMRREDSRRQD